MRQLFLAAITAGFVSFATEASATIYDATASQGIITLSGPPDWYTSQYPYDPLNPGDLRVLNTADRQYVYFPSVGSFYSSFEFAFDSALTTSTMTPMGEELDWGGSGPSPILSGTFSLSIAGISRDLTTATSFSILRYVQGFSVTFVGDGWTAAVPVYALAPGAYTFADPFQVLAYVPFNGQAVGYQDADYTGSYTEFEGETLEPRSMVVPEPGAWALLVMGIGLLGATLRRRRRTAQMRG